MGVSKTMGSLGSGLQIVECGLRLTTSTFLGSSMMILSVLSGNCPQGLLGIEVLVDSGSSGG